MSCKLTVRDLEMSDVWFPCHGVTSSDGLEGENKLEECSDVRILIGYVVFSVCSLKSVGWFDTSPASWLRVTYCEREPKDQGMLEGQVLESAEVARDSIPLESSRKSSVAIATRSGLEFSQLHQSGLYCLFSFK